MTGADKKRLLSNFKANPPAEASSIQEVESELGSSLPEDYAQFLQQADGGEGFIGNGYLILWRVGDLLTMNKAYEVAEYASSLFLFGSDGGGEAYAFDMRSDTKEIVSVPFVGMEMRLARLVASNFKMFLEELFES